MATCRLRKLSYKRNKMDSDSLDVTGEINITDERIS